MNIQYDEVNGVNRQRESIGEPSFMWSFGRMKFQRFAIFNSKSACVLQRNRHSQIERMTEELKQSTGEQSLATPEQVHFLYFFSIFKYSFLVIYFYHSVSVRLLKVCYLIFCPLLLYCISEYLELQTIK